MCRVLAFNFRYCFWCYWDDIVGSGEIRHTTRWRKMKHLGIDAREYQG